MALFYLYGEFGVETKLISNAYRMALLFNFYGGKVKGVLFNPQSETSVYHEIFSFSKFFLLLLQHSSKLTCSAQLYIQPSVVSPSNLKRVGAHLEGFGYKIKILPDLVHFGIMAVCFIGRPDYCHGWLFWYLPSQ